MFRKPRMEMIPFRQVGHCGYKSEFDCLLLDTNAAISVRSLDYSPRAIEFGGMISILEREPHGVPRIADDVTEGAFYLYPDRPTAEAGAEMGGTGFFVSRAWESPALAGRGVLYAVSNYHVVEKSGASVIRAMKADGSPDIIELMPDDWERHPTADLMAVCLHGKVQRTTHKAKWVEFERGLLTKEKVQRYNVGIGDDVCMVGRFIGHDGKKVNRPSLRFGNISVDVAGIFNPETGRVEESYAVEMRSKPGYSGSPVFVLGTPEFMHEKANQKRRFFQLLGVEWGHIYEAQPTRNKDGSAAGQHTLQPTGMNGVVPAWFLEELLGTGKLQTEFEAAEQAMLSQLGRAAIIPQAASPPAKGTRLPNPRHREDFKRLVDAAVKQPKSSG